MDCAKNPSIISYHACAHLLGELFYLVLEVFHEAITFPPSHENNGWCVKFVDVEENGQGCYDAVWAYCISLDT